MRMQRLSIWFLQGVLFLTALLALFLLIRLPLTEGRAADLDLFHIYADPFILYGYAVSGFFFIAMYKAFRILGSIGHGRLFSAEHLKDLRSIRNCALLLGGGIVLAGLYIRFFHAPGDDPAGFLALCLATTLVSLTVAAAVSVLEQLLQSAIDLKSGNGLSL